MRVEISHQDAAERISQEGRALLEQVLALVLAGEEISEDVEISVSFVDEKTIQTLNRTYRGLDQETDVLSFPLHEAEEIEDLKKAGQLGMLGDIVINLARVKSQAEAYGHSEEREAAYLAAHSLLHLLGYDHEQEEDQRRMRAKEEAVMDQLGLAQSEWQSVGEQGEQAQSSGQPEAAEGQELPFHSGFVALLGRPNVGKSTLLNALMERKLTITSNKPQTTRNTISLIYLDQRMQVIFLDTPGYQRPKNKLGEALLEMSQSAVQSADLILYMTDASPSIGRLDQALLDFLAQVDLPKVCLINQVDRITTAELAPLLARYQALGLFEAVLPLSAKKGEGLELLKDCLYERLPEGPLYYPEEMITDRSERFIVSELIREQCLENLKEELPHGIAVLVDEMKERDPQGLIDIRATIIVERDGHKGMVIGRSGQMLKRIGSQARKEIEAFLDRRVNLKLWVKVDKNWRNRQKVLDHYGYGRRS